MSYAADSVAKVAAEIAWLAKWAIIESQGIDFESKFPIRVLKWKNVLRSEAKNLFATYLPRAA
jgi:hypothetical protein